MGKTARVPKLSTLLAVAAAGALALSALPSNAAEPTRPAGRPVLSSAFQAAAAKYDVPREVLVGVGFAESHLDGHDGQPSQANGYGVMHLVSNNQNKTMSEATKLTGLPVEKLAKDNASNILGAAAVLDSYADQAGAGTDRKNLGKWYGVVAKYSHSADGPTARLYTDEVYRIIGTGVHAAGVTTAPQKVVPDLGAYAKVAPLGTRTKASIQAVDYPGAIWDPACTCNYRAGRTADHLDHRHPRDARVVRRHHQLVQEPVRAGELALRHPVERRSGHPDGGREGHRLARGHREPVTRSASSTRASSTTRPGSPTRCTARRPR